MKKHLLPLLIIILFGWGQQVRAASVYSINEIERGPHHKVLQAISINEATPGSYLTNQYTEYRTGWHYWSNGQWVESSQTLGFDAGNVTGNQSRHQVSFPQTLSTKSKISLVTPDGQQLQSLPVAIGYYDAATGNAVLLSALKSGYGSLLWPNQMNFPSVFSPVAADVKYTYTIAGLEQDVILRQKPPSPASFGLNPQTTRLEIWTEFLNPPTPARTARMLKPIAGSATNTTLVESNLVDEIIDFGAMMMVSGNAFLAGDATNVLAPVVKKWIVSYSRTYLIEGVEYLAVSNALSRLPSSGTVTPGVMPSRTALLEQVLPQWQSANSATLLAERRTAPTAAEPGQPGLVIDYLLVQYASDLTFKGDSTYLVSQPFYVSKNITLEGGAVVKYGSQAKMHVVGGFNSLTAPYQPAIFTALDDDTVGIGLPNFATLKQCGLPALALEGGGPLANLRFRNLQAAVSFLGGGYVLSHSQVYQCQSAFQALAAEVSVRNALVDHVPVVFDGDGSVWRGEHLTVDSATSLNAQAGNSLYLTNSLLVAVANPGTINGSAAVSSFAKGSLFQTAGLGGHYLATNSNLRAAGVTTINPELAAELAQRTTQAPQVVSNEVVGPITYRPYVARDTGVPTLGYHYDPLDYVWSAVNVSGDMSWLDGVAMGVLGNNGPAISGALHSSGSVSAPNRLARCAAAQEVSDSVAKLNGAFRWLRTPAAGATLNFNYTEFLALGEGVERRTWVGDANVAGSFAAMNCRFENGWLGAVAEGSSLALTNNLFRRAGLRFGGAGGARADAQFWNNLALDSVVALGDCTPDSMVFDNLFDGVSWFWAGAAVPANDFNGYVASVPLGGGTNDLVLDSFQYGAGVYGDYYQADHRLVDAGSRSAALAGLAGMTTQVSETPEGSSRVDIGLHYPLSEGATHFPPYLMPVADQVVDELTPLVVPLDAGDSNVPAQSIALEILAPPAGMVISNAALCWTPDETQGPGEYPITVVVRNVASPDLSVTQTCQITVREVNQAPVLTVPSDQAVAVSTPWVATNLAVDLDAPENQVFFSLIDGPAGLAIDPATGVMNWTPSPAQLHAICPITVVAYDDGSPSRGATQTFNLTVTLPTSPYTTVSQVERQRGANSKRWETVFQWVASASGQTVLATNQYVEQQTGWHYLDQGAWVEAAEEIAPAAEGAQAVKGQHRVWFPASITASNGVAVTMADGAALKGFPMALAYYDAASGQAVKLAALTNATLALTATNQATYADAFASVSADVRYTYTRAGLEQDVILRQNPPSPAAYGLDPASTRLEVWTEFFSAPVPTRVSRVIHATATTAVSPVEPQLLDERLDFGAMMMVAGKALATADGAAPALVAKRWVNAGGRVFLIEAVEYTSVSNVLNALPASGPIAAGELPGRLSATRRPGADSRQFASVAPRLGGSPAGLTIDYLLVNHETNWVYQGDTTYAVSGPVYLGGKTVFEGGAVIKYSRSAKLHAAGETVFQTTPYRPVIFTARDDDSAGAILPASTGYPDGYYAQPALAVEAANVIKHARFRYAEQGLALLGGPGYVLSHAQVCHCATGVALLAADAAVRNALFDQVPEVLLGTQSSARGEHLTVDGSDWLNYGPDTRLYLTNSALVNVVNPGLIAAQAAVVFAPSESAGGGRFQTAGAGAHYLPADSAWRNQGVTAIDGDLANELRELTTDAPTLVDGDLTDPTVYGPAVARDTDQPDLGYHYAPLDYVWRSAVVSAELQWKNGVAMGVLGTGGLVLSDGASLSSVGYPNALNTLAHCQEIQEQAVVRAAPAYGAAGLLELRALGNVPLYLRFSNVSGLGAQRRLMGGVEGDLDLSIADGIMDHLVVGVGKTFLTLTNNCLRRCQVSAGGAGIPTGVYMYNNLFLNSSVWLGLLSSSVAIFDNVFDHATIAHEGLINHGYNAYARSEALPGGANNLALDQVVYASGPLGDYYTVSAGLQDAGSRSAADAGLFHYTTSLGQAKEGDTQVDIGPHYVAVKYQFDSALDFTGAQGANNWYAQYAEAMGPVLGYMSDYLSDSGWWWEGSDSFCIVGQSMQHPGMVYDAVRSFLAPFDGVVRIDSRAVKAWSAGASDGTQMRILKNLETLVDWRPLTNYNYAFATNLTTAVNAGDSLRFQLNRFQANANDTTLWHVGIDYTNAAARRAPSDADGDGVPDYLEDSNGNGVLDARETSFTFADSGGAARKSLRYVSDASAGANPILTALLAHWNFNDTNLLSDAGDPPLLARDIVPTASFDGLGMQFIPTNNRPLFRIRERQAAGSGLNFTLANGTIRFYYRPNWSSQTNQGKGPGAEACLLAVGDPDSTAGGLQMKIDATGNNLSVVMGNSSGTPVKYVAPIRFSSNTWYQIGLYISSASGGDANRIRVTQFSAILIDQTRGQAWPFPTASARLNGLSLGSRLDGSQPALGSFDELDTYSVDLGSLGWLMNNFAIAAKVTPEPPGVEVDFVRGPNQASIVKRRVAGATSWTDLGNSSRWSVQDSSPDLTVGQRYEYQLSPVGLVSGQSAIVVGLQLPPAHDRGRILVLVDSTLASSLEASLSQYLEDLRGDGWIPIRYNVPRHNDAAWTQTAINASYIQDIASIKAIIRQEYQAAAGSLKSVALIGHVAIPYSGNSAEDGHSLPVSNSMNHQGAWPADIYYGDVDGNWTDTTVNYPNTYNPVLQNLPGDGKFDANQMVTPVELAVGRVDFANLPAFASPPRGVAPMSEVDLLKQYFAKAHRYRQRQFSIPSQSMVAGNFVGSMVGDNDPIFNNAIVNSTRWFGLANNPILPGDCFVSSIPVLWGFQLGYGNATAINNGLANQHSAQDLSDPAKEPPVGFYMVGGSFFSDWNMGDNAFMRALLATPKYGLAAVWMRNCQWRFETLALGDTLGDGLLRTANDTNQVTSCRTTYLLGDPTLRLNPVAPPRNLTAATGVGGVVNLSWLASVDAGVKYYVYRSSDATVPPVLLTAEPLAATSYADAAPGTGPNTYWVRASRLAVTGSGAYTNLSQGIKAVAP
jgi:hypothetical protein